MITHPRAKKASYFLTFFDIVTGISKTPGTLIILISLDFGISTFDASIAGLGGCPYAPGARGNVSTEAVIDFLESKGFHTGVDREKIKVAAEFARSLTR